MKPYLIGLFLGILLMGGIWYYADRNKEPEHDFEAENVILVQQRDEHEASELFHKNRADKAVHSYDSLLTLKPKIINHYYEKDSRITLLNADSTHNLLISNAQTDSIWN